jgi:hypothetical protein
MLRYRNNNVRCVLLGIALLFWLGGMCSAEDQLPPEGEREQDQGGNSGRFCANWLRISKKVPSKSLIP